MTDIKCRGLTCEPFLFGCHRAHAFSTGRKHLAWAGANHFQTRNSCFNLIEIRCQGLIESRVIYFSSFDWTSGIIIKYCYCQALGSEKRMQLTLVHEELFNNAIFTRYLLRHCLIWAANWGY